MQTREKGKSANKRMGDDAVDGDRAAPEDDLTAGRRAVSVIIRTLQILTVLEKCFISRDLILIFVRRKILFHAHSRNLILVFISVVNL